jgi:CheY-like chemotaxis protein
VVVVEVELRVLVVDDVELLRRSIEVVLKRAGCEVLQAADGQAAVALLRTTAVDAVLTDIIMPGKEGIETIMELREAFPALRIVAMSGGGLGRACDVLEVAKTLGADRILRKPFTPAQLLDAIGVARVPA